SRSMYAKRFFCPQPGLNAIDVLQAISGDTPLSFLRSVSDEESRFSRKSDLSNGLIPDKASKLFFERM
ncbi:MAG: hypothetical protein ACE5GQ_12150, partial [Nitrospinales bacterium]